MDKEQHRAAIKDLSYRLQFHTEQADFHRGVAEKTLKMVKRHEGQLVDMQVTEAEKPELREGGYGRDDNGPFFLWESSCLWNKQYGPGRNTCISRSLNKKGNDRELALWATQVTGNILDDLTAMSEELTEFDLVDFNDLDISFKLHENPEIGVEIVWPVHASNVYLRAKNLHGLILYLRRMEATHEREKNAKDNS